MKMYAIALLLQAAGSGRISYDLCEELVHMVEAAKDDADFGKVLARLRSEVIV